MGLSPAAILYDSSGNPVSIVNDSGTYRISGVSKLLNASGAQVNPATQDTLAAIKDTDGIKKIYDPLPAGTNEIGRVRSYLYDDVNNVAMAVVCGSTIPANTRNLLWAGKGADGKAYCVRTNSEGKVAVETSVPTAPSGTTEFVLAADNPLTVGPNPLFIETISTVVASGYHLHIQFVAGGAEGDPSEKGSMIELIWREGSPAVDHTIERLFVTGATVFLGLPDTGKARDGTAFTGNGTNTYLVLKRTRLSNSAQYVDAVARGYLEAV